MEQVGIDLPATSSHSVATSGAPPRSPSNGGEEENTNEIRPTISGYSTRRVYQSKWTTDTANRRKVAKALNTIGGFFTTTDPDRFDDSEFKHGKALDFPELPGEEHRNPALYQIRVQYNHGRDLSGNVTPSRAGSFIGSVASGLEDEGSSITPRPASPRSSLSPPGTPLKPQISTLSAERFLLDLQNPPSSQCVGSTGVSLRQRRDTLEVPAPTHHSSSRNNSAGPSTMPASAMTERQGSPSIVVSVDTDSFSSERTSSLSPPAPLSHSTLPSVPPKAAMPPSS